MIGAVLAGWARSAFISGMDLGLLTGALVAALAGLLALLALPGPARLRGRKPPLVVVSPPAADGDEKV